METLYALQWQNPRTLGWEACTTEDVDGRTVCSVYLSLNAASNDLEEWNTDEESYRIVKLEVQEAVYD